MDEKVIQEVASLMKDVSKREEFAEMMIEYIDPQHITTDFVGMLLNTRSLKPGDSLVKKVRKGIKVYTLVPGSIPLASEMTVTERMNYVLDGSIVEVTANEWELASGEIGTAESLRNEMQLKLRDHFQNKVFTALSTVWTAGNTPSNFTNVGGNVTKTALDNMLSVINSTTPGAKAIVGVRNALSPIVDFAGWMNSSTNYALIQSVADEIARTGWLGSYKGVPLVVINQDYDNPEDYNKLVPEDKILVIGQNVGEFITFGAPNYSQWSDPRPVPPQFYMRLYQQYGLIIDNAVGIGVLKVA
jgi:hypothetical protein